MRNVLMVISGPSGVGKGTIVKELLKRRADVVQSISCTTRAARQGEVHGKDYYFLSKDEFLKRIKDDDFLEYDEHFGNYYGTPKSFVKERLKDKSVVLEIDVVGGLNAKKSIPETVLVMIVPPSEEVLKARLVGRGTEDEEQIKGRLERLTYELEQQKYYDYAVVNDELDRAVEEIEQIIEKEKYKE